MPVAFLGLGHMGVEMARRLEDAGFDLTVYNRSPAPTEEFAARGVRVAATPAEAAADSIQRGFATLLETQKEFLNIASKRTA